MKKTLGILTLASTFLFGANNLLTIVEQNMYKGRYESMTSYYILAEMLFLRYLEYLEERSQSDES